MKARPTIFLSGVSHELGSFRDAVETEIQKKGCFPENQPSFPPDYRTVEEMLRRKLHDADAVVHIVGFRFGAEPNQRPVDASRRSYTQMEFDIARAMETPVYVFLSTGTSVRDDPKQEEKPEDAKAVALQLAHREAVQKTNHLYYFFKDKAELCNLVAQIPPVQAAGFQADISRIIKFAPEELIGRDDELKLLNEAWLKVRRAESSRPRVLTFVALGGEGKTSLVVKWAAELAHQDWPGCDAAFAWSFYSQGTRDPMAGSSDLFLKEALMFFGDAAMADSAQSSFDKGRRLAQLVGERRALLILDGLEPLQYPPTSPTPGELKDQGVAALLKGLAATSLGMCIVTTRYALVDLSAWQRAAPMHDLLRLSTVAGVKLLRTIGVKSGSQADFEKLVEDVDGHALTLQILGQFLVRAFHGDIRRRNRIDLEKADAKIQGGHAFRGMEAYVKWLENDSEEARREVAVLKMLGLFDRPATADCVAALLQAPAIAGLTEPLVGLAEDDWEFSLTSLRDAKLLTINREEGSGVLIALDAHPLLREYFAHRVREQHPEAWRVAHRRLYEHLCATTKEGDEPTLEDLQPLYHAVGHGCHAGMQPDVLYQVYDARIRRRDENYSAKKLGALSSDLGAIASFFETPWTRVSLAFTEIEQAWLLNEIAYRLRALGRLTEAIAPMRAGLDMGVTQGNWKEAAIRASNLSELELTLGDVVGAVEDAEQSVTYAGRGGDADWENYIRTRTTHADALYQAGRRAEAETYFREAEQKQAEVQPAYPLVYSMGGFRYCELLLTEAERAAWRQCLSLNVQLSMCGPLDTFRAVSERAATTLDWWTNHFTNASLLDIALDHLTLARTATYAAILAKFEIRNPQTEIELAVAGLRRSGQLGHLPRAILTRAWSFFTEAAAHKLHGRELAAMECLSRAQGDLDEAWEIAERGPMPLFLADIHLHRARLFFREANYPWESPQKDLAEARRLTEKHGYWRRKEELEDAELAILGKPAQ